MPAISELKRATNLRRIVRGDKRQGVGFQSIGKSFVRPIVTRSRYATRIFFVDSLRLRAPVRIQPYLANVSERAH